MSAEHRHQQRLLNDKIMGAASRGSDASGTFHTPVKAVFVVLEFFLSSLVFLLV